MPEPEITSSGPLVALIAALTALAGGALEYLRRRMKPHKETQLDRIEASLKILVQVLVVPTEEGGRVATSRRLAEGLRSDLGSRLDQIERLLTNRTPQLTQQGKKLDELAKKVDDLIRNEDSLASAVQSAVEILERHGKGP